MNTIRRIAKTGRANSVTLTPHVWASVIAGAFMGEKGLLNAPLSLDVTLDANGRISIPVPNGHSAIVYVVEGELSTGDDESAYYAPGAVIRYEGSGDAIALRAPAAGARLLLISTPSSGR